jgi:hypothetical protein
MLAALSTFGGALFAVDPAQWTATDRMLLGNAFTDLSGGGILRLVRHHGGEVV